MASRSLNKVMLIGNLTRDPELRYTPTGAAVCTIGLATNRTWTTESGEKKEEVEFHRIIAWSKLAELCNSLLTKGRKIYIEGRIHTNSWQAQDGSTKNITEIIMEDMMILDPKPGVKAVGEESSTYHEKAQTSSPPMASKNDQKKIEEESVQTSSTKSPVDEHVDPDDIPF